MGRASPVASPVISAFEALSVTPTAGFTVAPATTVGEPARVTVSVVAMVEEAISSSVESQEVV